MTALRDISAVRCICEENRRSYGIIDVQAGKQTLGARWCSGLPGELCCQTFDDFEWQLAPRTDFLWQECNDLQTRYKPKL
jgi:hypothetical protein